MKKLSLLFAPLFLLTMSFAPMEEPQFAGTDCVKIALELYNDLTNGEVDHIAALEFSFELLSFCEDNQ